MRVYLSKGDRVEHPNIGMDERKNLQNKQALLQGGANFPYLWKTSRHHPPSTRTIATHLELSFLKNSEGEQSSDRTLESLHNKLEDLPEDEIVIKESSITGKETQMASIGIQMEKKQVDDTKQLTYMRSSVSTVELVDVEDNEAKDDADRSLKIFSASQWADDDNNLTEVQDHSPNVEHPEKLPVEELMDLEE
ncbi:hypothetical protein Ancab_017454 [Ancistrocladus abbreviatus]